MSVDEHIVISIVFVPSVTTRRRLVLSAASSTLHTTDCREGTRDIVRPDALYRTVRLRFESRANGVNEIRSDLVVDERAHAQRLAVFGLNDIEQ